MRQELVAEIEQIQRNNSKRKLIADEVVDYARDPNTALHSQFEWDDTKAAEQHRLYQARKVIHLVIEFRVKHHEPIETYTSLISDRVKPRGGYSLTKDVLSAEESRAELLDMALQALARVQANYVMLTELAEVFEAADKVRANVVKKKARKKAKKTMNKGGKRQAKKARSARATV